MSKKKELSVILRARNMMATGLSKAKASLDKFGQSAMRIGKFFAKGFLAAGAAVVGFATKALAAYSVQEKAERSLAAAITAHGEAGEALIPTLQKIASTIQDETGAADEATLAGMAKMRMLGVQTNKLGDAARAVIALKSVGLEEAAAQKAVAMAMQGNYDMLNRYVPALRTTTDATEKAKIVNELFARGYEQQKAVLNTVSGQWGLLKGRIGDAWEEMGRAISQNDALSGALARVGDAVKAFTARLSEWASGGGVTNLIAGAKVFGETFAYYLNLVSNTAHILWASISDGVASATGYASNVIGSWKTATVEQFKYLGDYAKALWEKIKSPTSTFKPPNMGPYKAALKELSAAIKGESGIVTKDTDAALAAREKLHEDHAKAIEQIGQEQLDALEKQREKRLADEKAAADAEKNMAQGTAKAVAKFNVDAAKKSKQAQVDALKGKLDAIQKEKASVEEVAKMRVADYIEQRKAAKEDAKAREKDARKAAGLEAKVRRGVRLSKKDREFLDASRAIGAAQKRAGELGAEEATVAAQIEAAQAQIERLDKIREHLEKIRAQQDELLRMA